MARAKHTYAVRLGVEGGNRTKAELVSVGESGERSMRKIDRSADRASRELGTLGDRASSLRRGMRLLGGAVAGIAAAGGLALLVKRSIDAADAVGKTADKLGVGTAALQELRYAAQSAGIEQTTLDMALQRFTRRAAEAAKGTGEARDALKQMGIALKDQHGNMRRSEDLLNDVAEAFKNTKDPAERLRLAFKLFDSEGVAMVNMLVNGGAALEAVRQRARDLGIVLDEDLIRNAERAKDEMDTLGTVISANVTRALLGLAPALADASSWLANLAVDAGDAYEKLKLIAEGDFNFEGLNLGSTRREVAERRQELIEIARELKALPEENDDRSFWEWLWGTERENLTEELQEKVAIYQQWAAKLAWMQAEAEKRRVDRAAAAGGDGQTAGTTEDEKAAQQQARRLVQIEKSLNTQLFQLRHQGADRIRAEHLKLVTELQTLIEPDASNLGEIEQVLNKAAAVKDDKLAELADREYLIAEQREQANQRVAQSLGLELEALKKTERQRFVDVALRRLSAEATPEQRKEVERLAGALHDEQKAIEERNEAEREANRLRDEARALTESLRTAQEAYAAEIERHNELLRAGAIDQDTFGRASEKAYGRMLDASREWSDGVRRAIRDYLDEAGDAAKQFERVTSRALQASEDAFVEWATTGKFSAKDLFNTIAEEALRTAYRMAVVAPLGGIFDTIFDAIGSALAGGIATPSSGAPMIGSHVLFPAGPRPVGATHAGGVIGSDTLPIRMVDPAVFDGASRYHRGGIVGGAGDVPIWSQAGEGVFTPGQMRSLALVSDAKPVVNVAVNVRNTAPGTQASADVRREPGGDLSLDIVIEQVEGGMARHIGRGEGPRAVQALRGLCVRDLHLPRRLADHRLRPCGAGGRAGSVRGRHRRGHGRGPAVPRCGDRRASRAAPHPSAAGGRPVRCALLVRLQSRRQRAAALDASAQGQPRGARGGAFRVPALGLGRWTEAERVDAAARGGG